MDIKKVIATTVASSMMITSVVSFANNVSAYRLPAKYTDVSIKLSGLTEEHLKRVPLSMVLENMTYASDVYAEENSEDKTSEPTISDGETSEPTTSDGETSEPTTSDGETSEPTTSDGETSEPTTSDGETSEPAISDGETSEPTTSDGETSKPMTSDDETSEPATSDGETSEPATSDGETSEPATSDGETSEPATSDGETSEPATSDGETSEPMTSDDETSEPAVDEGNTENVDVDNEQQNGELIVDITAGDPIETETSRKIVHRKYDKVEFSADAAYIRIDDTVYSLSDETATLNLLEAGGPDEYVLVKEIIVSSDENFDSDDECFIASFFITKNFWSFDEFRFYTENENEEKVYLKTKPGRETDNSVAFTVFSPLERGKNIYLEAVPQLIWNDTVRGDVNIEVTYYGTEIKAENILTDNRITLDLRAFDENGALITEQYGINITLAEEAFMISADIVSDDAFENTESTVSISEGKSKLSNAAEFDVNFDIASFNSEFMLKIYKLGLLRTGKEIGEDDVLGAYIGHFTLLDEITEETASIAAELFGDGINAVDGTVITLFLDPASVPELVTVDADAFVLNITFNINVTEPVLTPPDTSEPTTSDTTSDNETSEPTASDTTSDNNTSEPTTSDTTSDNETSKPTTSDDTSEPTTSDDTSEPTTSDNTSEPTTSDNTSEPTTSDNTSEPTTSDDTSEPTTSDDTSEPTTSDNTSEPTTSDDTSEPTTSDDTSEPTTSDDTSEPTTSDDTSEPTTSDDTSEPTTSDDETSEPTTSDDETSKPAPTVKLWSGFGDRHSIFFNNLKDAYCELLFAYSGELSDLEVTLINADNIALRNVEVISGEAADEILAKIEAFKDVSAGESVELMALAEAIEAMGSIESNGSGEPADETSKPGESNELEESNKPLDPFYSIEPVKPEEPGEPAENKEYGIIRVRIEPVKDGYGRLFKGEISGLLSVAAANAEPLEIMLDGRVDVLQIVRRVTGTTPVKFIPYNTEFMLDGNVDYISAEFSASGLPDGLKISKKTGVISGIPENSGEFTAEISAEITFLDENGELQSAVITREASLDVSTNSARNLHMNSDPNYAIDKFLGDSFDGRTYYLDGNDVALAQEITLKGDVAEFVDLWINGQKLRRVSDDYKQMHGTSLITFSENALAEYEKNEIYTIVFAFQSAENDRMIYAAQNFSIVEDKASVPVTAITPEDYKDVYTPANRLDDELDRELADILGSVKLYTEQNAFEFGQRLVVKPYSTEFGYPSMTIRMVDENGAPIETDSAMTVGIALPESYEENFYLYEITNGVFDPISYINIKDGRLFFGLDTTKSYAVSKKLLNEFGEEVDGLDPNGSSGGTIVSGASAVRSFSEENPVTGIAVSGAGIVVSGVALAVIFLTGRRRKSNTNTK